MWKKFAGLPEGWCLVLSVLVSAYVSPSMGHEFQDGHILPIPPSPGVHRIDMVSLPREQRNSSQLRELSF